MNHEQDDKVGGANSGESSSVRNKLKLVHLNANYYNNEPDIQGEDASPSGISKVISNCKVIDRSQLNS